MNALVEPAHLAEPDNAAVVLEAPKQPVLPWSPEAEQSVLGGLLLDNLALDRIAGTLQESSFWHAAHRTIWTAITAQIAASRPADVITVFEALQRVGAADEVGGLAYLNDLAASVPSSANIRRYAEIVAEMAAHRATIAAADKALAIAREPGPMDGKLDRIAAAFAPVQSTQMRAEPRRLGDLVPAALERYQALSDGTRTPGWATGIQPLDKLLLGGLRPGKVYGVAARPSVGKSSLARAMAINLARNGHPVLLLSQEMPADEVTDCAIAQIGVIAGDRLQTGQLSDQDWSKLTEATEAAGQLPIYIDDDGGLTPDQIAGKARMVKGVQVLVLDYLQLSTSTLKGATTNDQIAQISKALKQLALRMGIAVVVLSQLSRKVEDRIDREPQLSDLRDSGAIEQDLDVAVLLWTLQEPEDGGPRMVGAKVAKHRGGPKGAFGLWFYAPTYRWSAATDEAFSSDRASTRQPARGGRTKGGFDA